MDVGLDNPIIVGVVSICLRGSVCVFDAGKRSRRVIICVFGLDPVDVLALRFEMQVGRILVIRRQIVSSIAYARHGSCHSTRIVVVCIIRQPVERVLLHIADKLDVLLQVPQGYLPVALVSVT